MSIGSILIQPQRISRIQSASKNTVLIDDTIRMGIRMLFDPKASQTILQIAGEAIQNTALRFQDRVSTRLNTAYKRLQNLIQPITDFFQSFDFDALEDNPDAGMQLAEQMLELFSNGVNSLSLDQLREYMTELIDILENDLGITGSFIEDEIWTFIADIINRLEEIPADAAREIRENRLDVAATLRRIQRHLRQEFAFPKPEAEKLARILLKLLRQTGIEDVATRAKCITKGLDDAMDAVSGINQVVQGIQPRSLGAAAADDSENESRYAWYATWLLQYKYRDIPLFEPDSFKDVKAFANKLKSPSNSDAVSRYIHSQFTEQEQSALNAYDGTSNPDDNLKNIILSVLNKLIQERQLDDLDAFGNVTLSEETREVRGSFIKDKELIRYNRMILEDVYPAELEKLPRSGWARFWYRVWELIKEGSGWPGEQVRVSNDGKYLMLGDKIMLSGTDVSWQNAPIFNVQGWAEGKKYYCFHHISKEFMEGWAWHSTWANDAIRTLWHLLYILQTGRAHFVPNLLNGLYDVAHGLTSGIARKPFSGFEFFSHKWLEWALGAPLTLTTAGSPQGAYTEASFINRLAFWFTVYMGDILNYAGPVTATNALRNLTLSFMTALNFRGPQDGPSTVPEHSAINYKELDGIVDAVVIGFTYWLASEVKREEYVHPFYPDDVPGRVWALWLAGGVGMGLFAGFVGTLIAEITAWAEDWALLGWTMLKTMPKVLIQFWPILYSLREGDTDDGKFNPTGGTEFTGYPQKVTNGTNTPSPYLLPYEAGKMINVGQGNLGVFSHNPRANKIHTSNPAPMQTYAYDFALDQAEEILASRPGTVVGFYESTPNDTGGDWNFIRIRHDVDDNGNAITPDPVHDRDVGGNVTRTFAVYGHGRQNGVTDAFARWSTPVPTANIIGTRVRRGQPIMLAGDTGTSFYNHLHMHVLPGKSGPTSIDANTTYAIPFIFQDVDGDGMCKALHWYESTNTRVT
ncbi:Na+/solute symporter [Candidatus Vecturithrix granuli]|uniref:Na+/solute symporter n=1 Tax=Vecturithrix granuli TaxID=1499967 RepID=A0A081C211_VECG1|nr:Na+/solute symporter [Candidatus Vecturithrix granuli]